MPVPRFSAPHLPKASRLKCPFARPTPLRRAGRAPATCSARARQQPGTAARSRLRSVFHASDLERGLVHSRLECRVEVGSFGQNRVDLDFNCLAVTPHGRVRATCSVGPASEGPIVLVSTLAPHAAQRNKRLRLSMVHHMRCTGGHEIRTLSSKFGLEQRKGLGANLMPRRPRVPLSLESLPTSDGPLRRSGPAAARPP